MFPLGSETKRNLSIDEFNKFYPGQAWDWFVNKDNITQYMREGTIRAKPYENIFTVGMRGSGDGEFMLRAQVSRAQVQFSEPLVADTNVPLLEDIVSTQRQILTDVFNGTDVSTIPQMWCLCRFIPLRAHVPTDVCSDARQRGSRVL